MEAKPVTDNVYVAIFVAIPVLERKKTVAPCSDSHVSQKVSRKGEKK